MATLRHQMNRFKIIIALLVILVICLGVILIRRSTTSSGVDPTLNIQSVQVRNVENIVSAEGNLHGVDERSVFLPTGTKLSELNVELNQIVGKDVVLGTVETANGVKTDIKSPIAGTVTQIGFKEGDQANATTVAFGISDITKYKVQVLINETDIPDIKLNQNAKISFPAVSLDDTYDATVSFISPAPVSTSGVVNYEVDLTPASLPDKVKLGMSTDVDITTAKVENVLAIPETYLIEKNDKDYVKVLTYTDDKKTQYTITETEIRIGLKTNEYIEVKSGVNEGDQIVEPSYVAPKAFSLFGS